MCVFVPIIKQSGIKARFFRTKYTLSRGKQPKTPRQLKMKKFLLAFLLAAFVAHIQAEALDDYLMEDEEDGEPDRHPYVQCKIDLYDCIKAGKGKLECLKAYKSCMSVLIPTIPPFVIQCKDQLSSCIRSSSGFLGKGKCFIEFGKCLKNRGPPAGLVFDALEDGEPTRHPYVQCKIDLYDCIKAGTSKLECLKAYKSCMAVLIPTIPPFVIACKDDLKTCLSSSSGILNKARCFRTFGQCLRNQGALVAFDEDDRHPLIQCKIDLYDCFKAGSSKLQCLRDYRSCLSVLLPTLPPLITLCNDARKACRASASGWKEIAQCYYGFAKCLVNKGPSSGLVFDAEDDVEPTRHPYVQCKIDAYDCIKSGEDKKQCWQKYKSCMSVLLPTIPPFIRDCYADFRTCYGGASGWQDKLKCGLDFTKCLKNKGVSL